MPACWARRGWHDPALYVGGGVATAICLLLDARGVRQERPVSAARLAARRDGRPHAGQRPDPRGHDGHGRRLHGRPLHAAVRRCRPTPSTSWPSSAASPRCWPALIAMTQTDLKRVLAYSTISQLGYMFLGLGIGTLAGHHGRHVPPVHARLLQGPAVPRRRQRDARHGRRDRHAPLQRPAAAACPSRTGRSCSAAWPWPASFPLPASGARTPSSRAVHERGGERRRGSIDWLYLAGAVRRVADGVLHVPRRSS